jgi:glucose/arabinose dehydrogenase
MQLTPAGHILVTARDAGEVHMVLGDADGDGRSDETVILADGLKTPHGIWLDGADLYVGEEHRIVRFVFDEAARTVSDLQVVLADLPANAGHSTRTVKRGPDGALYVTVGSSCNVCIEAHPWRSAMLRMAPGGEAELFATGLRNTIGFDWHPDTGALYGVDNARDWLGNDFPPDELNRIVGGGFYGWPYFNGDNEPDPDHGGAAPDTLAEPIAPAHGFAAHVAPMGITFLRHQSARFLAGSALVALHGSWNRDTKIGYGIVRLTFAEDGTIEEAPFVTGFEKDDDVIGRPVDVIEAPDGTLFVSDDYADVIYRIVHEGS